MWRVEFKVHSFLTSAQEEVSEWRHISGTGTATYVVIVGWMVTRTDMEDRKISCMFRESKQNSLWRFGYPFLHNTRTAVQINCLIEELTSLVSSGQNFWLLITRSRFDSQLYHGNFPCRGRIPVVTMVWVVSRSRLKVATSSTRSQKSINSDWTYEISSLEGTSSR
jgi:hypothetical protein